jgi:hypothetical protein
MSLRGGVRPPKQSPTKDEIASFSWSRHLHLQAGASIEEHSAYSTSGRSQ